MPGLSEAVQEVDRVTFEVAERTDVVGKIEHVRLIKSASNLMISRRCWRDQPLQGLSLKLSLPAPQTGLPEPTAAKSVDRGSD
jgi:hypothetical protein